MVLHSRFIEQPVVDEKMPLINGSADRRKSRADHNSADTQRGSQRLGNRPDVALRSGVESRAVFEDELTTACACSHRRAASDSVTACATSTERVLRATTPA